MAKGSLLKERKIIIKIAALFFVFVFFLFSFYGLKNNLNQRNAENKYLLSTVYPPTEKVDRYTEEYYTEIEINEPLTNEMFLAKAKAIIRQRETPQKIILTNVTNYLDESQKTVGVLDKVMISGSATSAKLLISRTYPMERMNEAAKAPFELTSTGALGLISNTLEYSVEVTNQQEPEEWVTYLPRFIEEIQKVNALPKAKSMVYIQSKSGCFLYESNNVNHLVEIKNQEME